MIPITPIYEAYLEALREHMPVDRVEVALENVQARIRGNIIMALSNRFGHLVLATGNKSELSVGYCTLYGDMSGGLSVLGDVPKTMVYELAHFLNRPRELIPRSIIHKAPSAELRPDQKDQDTLPGMTPWTRLSNSTWWKPVPMMRSWSGASPPTPSVDHPHHRPQRV